jgi:catechol 2,3-dioxygenase-like lactoylglutathione lyase family enzyme
MLDHVGIPVSDFERSKRFYEEALSPLGYELIMEPRPGAAGLGCLGKPDFWIGQGEPGHPVHVAFAAADRASVKAFHEAAVAAGATTVVPGSGPSTTRATTRPSSLIRTATTSKRSAIGQGRKPEPSDP